MKERNNEFKKIDFKERKPERINLLTDMLKSISIIKRPDKSQVDKTIEYGHVLIILFLIVEDAIYFNEGRTLLQEISLGINANPKIPEIFKAGKIKHNTEIGILECVDYFEYVIKNTTAEKSILSIEIDNGNLEQVIYRMYRILNGYPI